MAAQMRFHLPFRLGDKPQAGAAPQCTRQGSDGERTGIPEGVEDAGTALEYTKPLLAPREMVGFLAGGMVQGGRNGGIARRKRLSLIKGLRCHLARVVDPHETG